MAYSSKGGERPTGIVAPGPCSGIMARWWTNMSALPRRKTDCAPSRQRKVLMRWSGESAGGSGTAIGSPKKFIRLDRRLLSGRPPRAGSGDLSRQLYSLIASSGETKRRQADRRGRRIGGDVMYMDHIELDFRNAKVHKRGPCRRGRGSGIWKSYWNRPKAKLPTYDLRTSVDGL